MNQDSKLVDNSGRRRWVILGVVYACILAHTITLQIVPPNLSLILKELGLTYAQGGLLMSFFALPGIAIAIPAGMLIDRYGQKTIGAISLLLMIIGSAIFALGDSFGWLAFGRIIAGIGGMTIYVLGPQLIVQWFAGRRQVGTALGIFNTIFPVGIILSMNVFSRLGESLGWRNSVWLSVGWSVISLIVFLALYAPAPRINRPARPAENPFKSLRHTGAPIWLVGVAWMLFNSGLAGVLTFTPDLLRSQGFTASWAGFITSLIMCPALVINPLIGYTTDRVDHKRVFIALGGLAWAALVIWIPIAGDWVLPLVVVLGTLQTGMPAPTFALAAEVIGLEKTGLGYGIISTFLNVGLLAGPALVGFVRDLSTTYRPSYFFMAFFTFMVAVDMLILSRIYKRKPIL